MNLNEKYGLLNGQLLNETTILSLKLVFSRLQMASLTISPSAMTSTNHSTMTACDDYGANKGSHGHPGQSFGGRNVPPHDDRKCTFCSKPKLTEDTVDISFSHFQELIKDRKL